MPKNSKLISILILILLTNKKEGDFNCYIEDKQIRTKCIGAL